MEYILIVGSAILFLIAYAMHLIIKDAKIKSKSQDYVTYANEITKDFIGNKNYSLCSAKGFRVKQHESGKYIVESQARLIRPSFFD